LAAAIVVGGLTAGWLVLPDAGLRWGLIRTLRDFGMVDVSIAGSNLSLFDGHLKVKDVLARAPLGSSALGVGDIALRFRWGPLFSKRLAIDHLELTGVTIDLRRETGSDVFVLNGLPLALSTEPPPTADAPPVVVAKTAWGIDLAELDLTDSRLLFASGSLKADIAIRRLLVTNLHSQDPDLPVAFTLEGSLNGAPVTMTGTVLPFVSEPSFTLTLTSGGLDLALFQEALGEIGLGGAKGAVDLEAAVVGKLTDTGPTLTATGKADIKAPRLAEPVGLNGNRLALDLKQAVWDGTRLELSADLTGSGLTMSAPPVTVSAAALRIEATPLRWEGRQWSWQGSLGAETLAVKGAGPDIAAAALHLDATPARLDGSHLTWQGGLNATALALTGSGPDIAAATIRWTGQAEANGIASANADGRLDLESGRLAESDYAVTLGKVRAEGKIQTGPAKAALPIGAHLKLLTADKIAASATRGARDWMAANRIEAAGLTLSPAGGLAATRMGVEGLTALRRGGPAGYPWRVEARSLRFDRPAYDGTSAVSAGSADIAGLTLRVTRTETGLLGFSFPASGKESSTPAAPLTVALNRLTVGDGSKLWFEDRSLNEPVRLMARPLVLTVSQLDSAHPDRDSPFDLSASIGNATIVASGAVRPFADSPGGRVDARITALELPPLSPYLAEALGVHLSTGHFDGTVRGGATNGALDGQIELTLSNLFIAAPDPNAPLVRQTGMPVETMLDLLRGSDDRIRLSIPVRGRLDSPDFDVSDAVAQAVAGAVSSTVMATLKVAFPFTALISLVTDLGGDNNLKQAPHGFPTGSAALSDEHRKTLDQVATLMQGRDSLRLTLCGKAVINEGQALALQRRSEERPLLSRLERLIGTEPSVTGMEPADRDALIALANRRAAISKNYLSEQAGIAADRLFTCRGVIEENNDKGPRVDLLL
jgi:uncharacterized protein involved in outer membrane biogenesis